MVLKYLSHELDKEAAKKLVETMNRRRPVPFYLREFYDKCYKALSQVKKEEEYKLLLGEMDKEGYTEEEERDLIRRSEDLEKIEAALDEFVFAETKEQVLAHLK